MLSRTLLFFGGMTFRHESRRIVRMKVFQSPLRSLQWQPIRL